MILKNNLQKLKLFRLVVLFFGKLQFFQKFILGFALALTMGAASFFFGFGNALERKRYSGQRVKAPKNTPSFRKSECHPSKRGEQKRRTKASPVYFLLIILSMEMLPGPATKINR